MSRLFKHSTYHRVLSALLAIGTLALCGPIPLRGLVISPARAQDPERQALSRRLDTILQEHGNGIQAGFWLGGPSGDAWFERNADVVMPTASSIKTFLLVELFWKYHKSLDAPVANLDTILDDKHPAISYFSPKGREEIRLGLRGVTVRQLGEIMIGKAKATNLVYNAASNVAIAALGGPEAATKAIHDRDPAFASVMVNRYMLTNREKHGDNELKPASLAALYQRLASKRLKDIDPLTMLAIRNVLYSHENARLGRLYFKGGTLNTKPVTIVRAGWWDTPKGPLVFAVMTVETGPDAPDVPAVQDGVEASDALSKTAIDLSNALINAGIKAMAERGER